MILDAALAEFAEHGFERASTNRIVARAGIGKGMLFHYFGTKRDLYHYLIEYALTFIIEQLVPQLDLHETGLIERYMHTARVKSIKMAEHPEVFNFLANVYVNDLDALPPDLRRRLEKMQQDGFAQLFEDIDVSLFREDVRPELMMKIIRWIMEGYQQDLVARLKESNLTYDDTEPYWNEFYELLAVLKRILYQQEEDGNGSRHDA